VRGRSACLQGLGAQGDHGSKENQTEHPRNLQAAQGGFNGPKNVTTCTCQPTLATDTCKLATGQHWLGCLPCQPTLATCRGLPPTTLARPANLHQELSPGTPTLATNARQSWLVNFGHHRACQGWRVANRNLGHPQTHATLADLWPPANIGHSLATTDASQSWPRANFGHRTMRRPTLAKGQLCHRCDRCTQTLVGRPTLAG